MSRSSIDARAPLTLALALTLTLQVSALGAAPRDLFHQRYDRAVAAYKARDFAAAAAAFEAAYELRQLPRLIFNIAQARRQLGDARGALALYEKYLRVDMDLRPTERAEVEDYIAKLRESTQVLATPAPVVKVAPPPAPAPVVKVAPPPPPPTMARRPRWRLAKLAVFAPTDRPYERPVPPCPPFTSRCSKAARWSRSAPVPRR